MRTIDPKHLMFIGAGLMVLGIVFPLLMLLKILESTFFLNFLSYILQITGLILAMIGLVSYAGIRKH